MRSGTMAVALAGIAALCAAATASGQVAASAASSAPAAKLTCGDWEIDYGLEGMDFSAEQRARLEPLFEQCQKEARQANEKTRPIKEKLRAAFDAAIKAGTAEDVMNTAEYQALTDEMTKLLAEQKKAADARYSVVIGELIKVLTPAQKRKFIMRAGMCSSDPELVLQARAAYALDNWAPGIELDDQRYDEIVARLVVMIRTYEADLAKAQETNWDKHMEWWNAHDKGLREFIESRLRADQVKQAAAGRRARWVKNNVTAIGQMARSLDYLGLTAAQKDKAAALAKAACEKVEKLAPEDPTTWGDVFQRFAEDLEKLLTAEQRAKRDGTARIE